MRLLLGSGNPAKLARLHWVVEGLDVEILTPAVVGPEPTIVEGDRSPRENAIVKAVAWAARYRLSTLASDGGLVVPALGDRWSAARPKRAAGEGVTDAQRAEHLLGLMRGLHGDDRLAHIVEAGALAGPDGGLLASWVGESTPRRIGETFDPRGLPSGFWLQGLFLFEPGGRRFGDLAPEERWALDEHWVELRRRARPDLETLLRQAQQQATRPS